MSYKWTFQRTHYWTLKFKMAKIRHLENCDRHISTKSHPILMKIGTQMQIWNSMTVKPNMKIFRIQDGGRPPFKKVIFWL